MPIDFWTERMAALRVFLEQLPADSPGMVVVQHMPEGFPATLRQPERDRIDRRAAHAAASA